jgi:hypothetical protein
LERPQLVLRLGERDREAAGELAHPRQREPQRPVAGDDLARRLDRAGERVQHRDVQRQPAFDRVRVEPLAHGFEAPLVEDEHERPPEH